MNDKCSCEDNKDKFYFKFEFNYIFNYVTSYILYCHHLYFFCLAF